MSSAFHTTHWSMVVAAQDKASPQARAALAALCEAYWAPLYAFVRRRGHDVADAQDLAQEFFARLLEKDAVGQAAPARGRFRSFLLASMKNFLANEWDRAQAQKRGGGRHTLTLDLNEAESRLHLEPAHADTPERVYEREWAVRLLEVVMQRLAAEFASAGKSRRFELLQSLLTGERHGHSYAQVASDLDMSEDAARQATHRLRRRYKQLLRDEVAHTVANPEEVEEEIRSLFDSLSR